MKTTLKTTFWCLTSVLALAAAACGSDDDDGDGKGGSGGTGATGATGATGGSGGSTGGSGGSGGTAGSTGGAAGAGGTAGGSGGSAGSAGQSGFSGAVPLDPNADDRLWAVTFDGNSKIVAVGFSKVAASGDDTQLALARFETSGAFDTSFGSGGMAKLNVKVGGDTEVARGVQVQSDGKILVCGNVEHDPSAQEPDVDGFVARFNADGSPDTGYGTGGVAIVDFSTSATISDFVYDCDLDGQGRLVLFGYGKNPSADHRDRYIARLTTTGELDPNFATAGIFSLDVDGLAGTDNARNGFVQADGKIVSAGYTPVGGQNEIVLIRLNDDGTLDTSFDTDGVLRHNPLTPGMAEAYGAVQQSTGSYVTTGYGRLATSGPVDLVSFRYSAAGAPDNTWGTSGGVVFDLAGDERGRNAIVLADDRVVMLGSGSTTGNTIDAMVLMLSKDGALDTSFNTTGHKLYDFGNADEAFFGAAVSGNMVAAVGYTSPDSGTDDAVLLLLPL